ncbi:MAG TPA: hypothetical protein VIO94_05940 [Phenylobacterium sp.]
MFRLLACTCAAGLLAGCGAIAAPTLNVTVERPGCSSLARAFIAGEGGALSPGQIINGIEACEARDRLGAIRIDPHGPRADASAL